MTLSACIRSACTLSWSGISAHAGLPFCKSQTLSSLSHTDHQLLPGGSADARFACMTGVHHSLGGCAQA